jgi:hypothetical protein
MRFVSGEYEPKDDILRLWHPQPVSLDAPAFVDEFFREVYALVRQCPRPPYLLVDYTNLQIAAELTQHYASRVREYRGQVAGVFRYNLNAGTEGVLTRVTVLLANRADANIFPDEASAREAIRRARQGQRPSA